MMFLLLIYWISSTLYRFSILLFCPSFVNPSFAGVGIVHTTAPAKIRKLHAAAHLSWPLKEDQRVIFSFKNHRIADLPLSGEISV